MDGCTRIFHKWGDARRHMAKECGRDKKTYGKPNRSESASKAQSVMDADSKNEGVVAEALPKPWSNVSEQELVALIRPFYANQDMSPADKRKYVLGNIIRP